MLEREKTVRIEALMVVCPRMPKALVVSQHPINLVKCHNLQSDLSGPRDKRIRRFKVS